ncbi:hypothetical protein OO009_01665 [Flavobacteriaceae bacterium KMM 6897]|nr:hypothetical protein [Flavobacteriaceae bacterium KMM 6897]MEB8346477.1 hypothetical protein [Flavobacteriaceae bacterium KMM 6898]
MGRKHSNKRPWMLNMLIVVTVIVVFLVFTAHYKNWIRTEKDTIEILSGIYYKELQYSEIDSVKMVEKIPSLERINGFSAMEREKGLFRDSIHETEVYMYVDRLSQPKIKIVYQDSLKLFLNLTDSTETQQMFQFLTDKIKHVQE